VTEPDARELTTQAGEVPGSSLTADHHDAVHLPGQYKAWCARCADDAEARATR
jgi:hypothetical protein